MHCANSTFELSSESITLRPGKLFCYHLRALRYVNFCPLSIGANNDTSAQIQAQRFYCEKCGDVFNTKQGAADCLFYNCSGKCERCETSGAACDVQRRAGCCSTCEKLGVQCQARQSIQQLHECSKCHTLRAVAGYHSLWAARLHEGECPGACERCARLGLRCRRKYKGAVCIYCRDEKVECSISVTLSVESPYTAPPAHIVKWAI